MAAPDLNPNRWYSLYVNNNNKSALMSTNLFSRSGTAGAVYFAKSAPDNSTQRWQIFPVGNSTFVLRTQEGGSNAFIGSQPAQDGVISPLMLRGDVADDSVFWQFGSWGDGTWFLWNQGNGTDYHLGRNGSGVAMDANTTAPQNQQRWGFDTGKRIDDKAYSSVNLLGATLSSPAPTSSQTSTPSNPPPSSSSSGLSTPAKAAIGGALGAAALIALIVSALFWRRRRLRKRASASQDAYEPYLGQGRGQISEVGGSSQGVLEMDGRGVETGAGTGTGSVKYAAHGLAAVEVDARAQERPAELMGDVGRG